MGSTCSDSACGAPVGLAAGYQCGKASFGKAEPYHISYGGYTTGCIKGQYDPIDNSGARHDAWKGGHDTMHGKGGTTRCITVEHDMMHNSRASHDA